MILASLAVAAVIQTTPTLPDRLNGAWNVDLTVNPTEPYIKSMHLTLAPDGTVTGDFYDSTIEAGRWKSQNGRVCVSFRTTDGVGPYHSAGCLNGDRVEGQTWAEHRNFVFVWTASRP